MDESHILSAEIKNSIIDLEYLNDKFLKTNRHPTSVAELTRTHFDFCATFNRPEISHKVNIWTAKPRTGILLSCLQMSHSNEGNEFCLDSSFFQHLPLDSCRNTFTCKFMICNDWMLALFWKLIYLDLHNHLGVSSVVFCNTFPEPQEPHSDHWQPWLQHLPLCVHN